MLPTRCVKENPIVNSELMLASENCLKLFHQTDGLTSCNGQLWRKSAASSPPVPKLVKGSLAGVLACTLPLIRAKLPDCFLNHTLSRNYTV